MVRSLPTVLTPAISGVAVIAALTLGVDGASSGPAEAESQATTRTSVTMREAAAALPGVRLWYIDSGGSGVPVVFMHAATGSVRNWDNQISAFTDAGYRFIAFDRRGWGRYGHRSLGSPARHGGG